MSSATPRVVTATVALFDVPPQELWRNVMYRSPFGDGKSRGATGGLFSSEAWFIYLKFRYRDWGALLHFVLTATFVKFVYIVYFFPAFPANIFVRSMARSKKKRSASTHGLYNDSYILY
jgi:hypothetical protein